MGAPVVDTISRDTAWVMDSNAYLIRFHDENDSVVRVCVAWGDGVVDTVKLATKRDSLEQWHKYGISNDVTYRCSVTVIDNDSVYAGKGFNIRVLRGAPQVDSVWADTADTAIFINDNRRFNVKVSDPNDYVDTAYVSWAGGDIAQAAIQLTGSGQVKTGYFSKSFTLNDSGPRKLRFWCRDVDGIVSEKKDTTVNVRIGRPVLWGEPGDTTWVIVDSGSGRSYRIHINSRDTNGTISRFYWDEKAEFDSTNNCEKTNDGTRTRLISSGDMVVPFNCWIYGRDDDGLLGGKRFVVYADSVPPKPVVTSDPVTGGRKISWSGKDGKDGDGTLYQIVCDKNPNPTSVISAFKAGSLYESGAPNKDFSFTFTPSVGSGTYYYKVISKDTRGSVTMSDISNFDY